MADGTPGDDLLSNTDEYNYGYDGNDYILTHQGPSSVNQSGGNGNDELYLAYQTAGYSSFLVGGAGNDRITGAVGNDSLFGGDDIDLVRGHSAETGSGNDFLSGGAGTDGVYGYDGDDALYGNEGDDKAVSLTITVYIDIIVTFTGGLYGGAGNDKLDGGEGDDWLDGGTGNDKLYGGTGNDVMLVDAYSTDSVFENAGEGYDVVIATNGFLLTAGQEVEELHAAAGTAPMTLRGNELVQTVRGNDGENTISTGGGADTAYGMGGRDFLEDYDAATLYGGAGDDIYILHNASTLPVEAAGEGRDSVYAYVSYKLAEGTEIEELAVWSRSVMVHYRF